ncbi:MAG: glycogen debranching protein GlgX [Gammaproteobacteria bacterium]|nr:glycogen debranching protein GlgX [Gammaproteobacteria bacterium]
MESGSPAPLGPTVHGDGVNFALYSSVAERVELCLFKEDGRQIQRIDLPECSDNVWHGFVPDLKGGQRYGYRVHGPYRPDEGLLCNPEKLLIDPYARMLDGEFRWGDPVFGDRPGDSADNIPKCVVCDTRLPTKKDVRVPWSETIFYEANVRGFTMRHASVDDSERGTFAGMRHADVLAYLKSLGITSIELMPVQSFIDEHHLVSQGLRNYWGYNTINFFAPMQRYARGNPVTEFCDMVNAIHDAGFEVIMDVVYNHTGEADSRGPMLSFRGIDNLCYYRVEPDDPAQYINDTGCGNTINADHPIAQQLILDSLRYWANDMGVDGFRFDLATVLGRHGDGFSAAHPLLKAIAEDPQLSGVKLVAEPWDPGPGGYQLGHFRPPWVEWNDRFRDTARRFWRSDDEKSGSLARRLHGSSDLFEAGGRTPSASVNILTTHDGYTLNDLVSYEYRHNEANGEDNRDGHSHNYSCNHGVEGNTDDDAINARRRQHRLNLLATLFVSQGTPLLLAGDEFGNSQDGNNNAYAQDNEIGWLDWSGIENDPQFTEHVKKLLALRRQTPLLRLDKYVHGSLETERGLISLGWINPDGELRSEEDWSFGHAFGVLLTEEAKGVTVNAVALLFNAWHGDLPIELPALDPPLDWHVQFCSADKAIGVSGPSLTLPGDSIAIVTTTNVTASVV